jgi:tetratricopeptide (TPR) repeat protein
MNEPKESNESQGSRPTPDGGAAPATRLAIFERTGADKVPVAIVNLSKNEDGTWSIQAGGPSDSSVENLRPLFERFSDARKALTAPSNKSLPEALSETLTAEGFIVEELTGGDHQVNFQIDLNTGLVVGTHAAMHPFAEANDALGRNVFDAIAKAFGKIPDELADEIDTQLTNNDTDAAISAVKQAMDRGLFGLRPTEKLLNSLMRIEVSRLGDFDKRLVRDCRLHVAQRLNRFEIAGVEANAILAENAETLDPEQKATLKMGIALAALVRGNRETALRMFRDLLKRPADLKAEGRGWAWRNISFALPPDDPEARFAAQQSADAFLEAGKKEEAGKSLFRLANLLLRQEPAEAVKALNEMVTVLDREGLADRFVRAAALHARANRLAKLRKHAEAFRDASEAVELQRGLLGAETQFVSSLHLAAIEAKHIGEDQKADALVAEAEKLTDDLKIAHFQLAQRVSALATAFDPTLATEILRDAEATKNLEVVVGVKVIQATSDPSLTDAQRLELLEETERRLVEEHGRKFMVLPVRFGIGRQLALMGETKRAIEWFRKVLVDDPLDFPARQALIASLWKLEMWGEAATFLRGVLEKFGEMPGLQFAYGKSLLESGNFSAAVTALDKSARLAHDPNLRNNALELRERAISLGGTILPPAPPKAKVGPVTRDEFEAALSDFARFISSTKRMTFWTKAGKDYEWIESPESRAKDLLHTFLRARFGERIDIFEELAAGAGRLDVYVKFLDGLSVIVELKMCGFGYSETYAAEGEEQIIHYMDNRSSYLGYLVVFDARLTANGRLLISGGTGRHTIVEKLIDVAPRVKRGSKKR